MSPEPFPFPEEPLGKIPRSCARRRENDPLAQVRLPSGDDVRLAVRFGDVRAVLTDPRFSRDLSRPGDPRLQPAAHTSAGHGMLINLDPPRHTRIRRILSRAFTARGVEVWRPRIREIARELIDGMLAGSPPADLITAFAGPLPIRVIAEVLGVAGSDLDRFRHWADVAMSIGTDAERTRGREEFSAYLTALIEQHRREPSADLLDAMIEASDGGDRLSEEELHDTARILLVAGHETTMTTLGRGAFSLLRHPGQYAELAADPNLLSSAVEEILRHDFPADVGFLRVARQDVELPSGVVRKGEGVMPLISSANADSARFSDANAFDIHRADNRHISFGQGAHYCIGANLARVQLQEAFDVLIRGVPKLRLAVPAEQVSWRPHMVTHSIAELPVEW